MDSSSVTLLSIKKLGLRNKSHITPPTSVAVLELYIKKTEQEIKAFLHDRSIVDHSQNNLNHEKKLALASLLARCDITIKPAETGGSIVIRDTVKYE